MHKTAHFSPCRTYRYELRRIWGPGCQLLAVIGLNPSTADETQDDPTIRRCIRYAKDWGLDGLVMLNLFAFRSTDPKALPKQGDAVGPLNDSCLKSVPVGERGIVLCAWGANKFAETRSQEVLKLLEDQDLHVLGLTKAGAPRHPLYMKADLKPTLWKEAGQT